MYPTFYCGPPTIAATENELKTLDEESALGPDLIPTRILKQCAHALAPVLHKLVLAFLMSANGQRYGEYSGLCRSTNGNQFTTWEITKAFI